jgi:hypothetical protein
VDYAYLAATLPVGVLLYWRRPGLYVGFTWWLWFLTPEVRRLVDYVQGWDPINPVMLAPYLVSALTIFTLVHHLPKLLLNRYFPFVLIGLGLLYAYAVGVYRVGAPSATYHLLEYSVPIAFGFYLVVHWRRYPLYRLTIQRTFAWGALVMGVYGLIQFLYLPPWDRYWMLSAPITSIGEPYPLEVRVFSTLNSPQPFGAVMMAGLLLLFCEGRLLLRWPAAAVGFVSFLLSLARTAWGGWLVAVLFILTQRGHFRSRVFVTLAGTALLSIPLFAVGPVADTINSRLQTITEIRQDNSFRARTEFYAEFLPQAFSSVRGDGLGSTGLGTKLSNEQATLGTYGSFDSGVMEIPLVLGWPGMMLYVGGLIWLLVYAFRNTNPEDLFAVVSRGIVVAMLAMLLADDTTNGLPGMLLWSFLCLAMAGKVQFVQTFGRGGNVAATKNRRKDGHVEPSKGVARGAWLRAD